MNDIDVLAHKRITRRIGKHAYERAIARISRQVGVPESVVLKMVDRACKEQEGRPYDGPVDFGRAWNAK